MSNTLKILGLIAATFIMGAIGFGGGFLGLITGYYAKTRRKSILWASALTAVLVVATALISAAIPGFALSDIIFNFIGAFAIMALTYISIGRKG